MQKHSTSLFVPCYLIHDSFLIMLPDLIPSNRIVIDNYSIGRYKKKAWESCPLPISPSRPSHCPTVETDNAEAHAIGIYCSLRGMSHIYDNPRLVIIYHPWTFTVVFVLLQLWVICEITNSKRQSVW